MHLLATAFIPLTRLILLGACLFALDEKQCFYLSYELGQLLTACTLDLSNKNFLQFL